MCGTSDVIAIITWVDKVRGLGASNQENVWLPGRDQTAQTVLTYNSLMTEVAYGDRI